MDSPAATAEIFTIDFVPEDGEWMAGGAAEHRSTTPVSGLAVARNPRPESRVPSEPDRSSSSIACATSSSPAISRRPLTNRRAVRSLDQFIGDQSNHLVNWLWQVLSRQQFHQWPLTLHGPSGVGKSKLAMRLALTAMDAVDRTDPASRLSSPVATGRVLKVDGKDFYRSFRRSLEINSVTDWRQRWETAPVLLLDDLQHLLDHPDAQHELSEVLDRRLDREAPTLLVSGLSPLSMGLIPSLASRLSGGFCCGLSAPGRLAMLTIIQRLFVIQNVPISRAEAVGLLDLGVSDIGLVNQLVWRWKLEHADQPFVLSNASESVRQMVGSAGVAAVAPEKILRVTAKLFECTVKDLRGGSRKSGLVRARGVFIWICRHRLKLSFKKIGSLLGNRDHTTIMNGLEKIGSLLDTDAAVALALDRILQRLGLPER